MLGLLVMNTRQWFFSGVAVLLQIPYFTYAAGLVPCGGTGEPPCQTCHAVQLINEVNGWLVGILSIAAAIMFMIAGFRILTAQGNPSVMKAAKEMIVNVAIGFMIVLAAWLGIDFMMKALVGDGQSQMGPWNVVNCVAQPISRVDADQVQLSGGSIGMAAGNSTLRQDCDPTPAGNINCDAQRSACSDGGGTPTVNTDSPTNHFVTCTYSATSNAGSCEQVASASNPCHESNLSMFGSRAAEASIICNKESGGTPIRSGSDLCCGPGGNCSGAPSFSGGYFQINVLAHADRIPGCTPGAFYERNGTDGPQGNCVRRNARGVCTGWSCTITDQNMYNRCMQVTANSALNFEIAEELFASRGFNPWSWSARICGVPQ